MRKKSFLFLIFLIPLFKIPAICQIPYGLNSNPSARPTAFLDFDGQTIDDVYWRPFSGESIIYCNRSGLTNASMIKVFNHVAEDFRPFNINITTDSSVYFAAPVTKRVRVVITPTWGWYGAAGGVAYVESFRWGLNTPCFVFDTLLDYSDKRVAEATSHEIGHTLGLYHQSRYLYENTDTCRFNAEYHPGRGSGDIAWAPIMGQSYDRNLGIWHIGKNSFGCKSPQNDLEIITNTANGITYRADDHGNTINTSTLVSITNGDYLTGGIINDSSDNDYFEFKSSVPGRFIANINPFNSGPPNIRSGLLTGVVNYNGNIDLEASLFRNNTLIRTYNPATSLSASIDTILDPGNYYLKINSTSNPNIFKSGMLGSYTLVGSFGGSIIVPIYSLSLKADDKKLQWEIISDEIPRKIWIEGSERGYDFKILSYVSGFNGSISREFDKKMIYYRLVAMTNSGMIHYSKTIKFENKEKKVQVLQSNNQIILNSPISGEWRILDILGKKIQGGRLNKGSNQINITSINPGIYFLQFFKDNVITIEKIIIRKDY